MTKGKVIYPIVFLSGPLRDVRIGGQSSKRSVDLFINPNIADPPGKWKTSPSMSSRVYVNLRQRGFMAQPPDRTNSGSFLPRHP